MQVRRLPEWVENEYDLELYHHGVKGQKWGVRHYQNPDGTLTPEGKKRYGTKNNILSANDVDEMGKKYDSARVFTGLAGFGSAGGLLITGAIMSQPILAVPALAIELGTFAADSAIKKVKEKRMSEAENILNQPQGEIYKRIKSTRSNYENNPTKDNYERLDNLKTVSKAISENEHKGVKYTAHNGKDGTLEIESERYTNFKNEHPNLKGDELNNAYAKKYDGTYYKNKSIKRYKH